MKKAGTWERSRFIEEIIWTREKQTKHFSGIQPFRGKFSIRLHPKQAAIQKTPEVVEFFENISLFSQQHQYLCSLSFKILLQSRFRAQ